MPIAVDGNWMLVHKGLAAFLYGKKHWLWMTQEAWLISYGRLSKTAHKEKTKAFSTGPQMQEYKASVAQKGVTEHRSPMPIARKNAERQML